MRASQVQADLRSVTLRERTKKQACHTLCRARRKRANFGTLFVPLCRTSCAQPCAQLSRTLIVRRTFESTLASRSQPPRLHARRSALETPAPGDTSFAAGRAGDGVGPAAASCSMRGGVGVGGLPAPPTAAATSMPRALSAGCSRHTLPGRKSGMGFPHRHAAPTRSRDGAILKLTKLKFRVQLVVADHLQDHLQWGEAYLHLPFSSNLSVGLDRKDFVISIEN